MSEWEKAAQAARLERRPPSPPPRPTREEIATEDMRQIESRILASFAELKEFFAALKLPAPQVNVEAPDVNVILQAVAGLRPGATAEEIADALVPLMRSPEDAEEKIADAITAMNKGFERMYAILQGISRSYGGAGPTTTAITDNADRELGKTTVKNFPADYPDAAVLAELGRRLSQKTGRTYVTKQVGDVTATTMIHTVTANKTFYLTGIILSVFNESITARFIGGIDDDTTRRVPLIIPAGIAGTVPPFVSFRIGGFLEPLQFSTNVKFMVDSGTPRASIAIVGYEETN